VNLNATASDEGTVYRSSSVVHLQMFEPVPLASDLRIKENTTSLVMSGCKIYEIY
jgi:hypothetical protein